MRPIEILINCDPGDEQPQEMRLDPLIWRPRLPELDPSQQEEVKAA